jgi:phytoene dehydrogenase-like protein
MSAWGVYQVFVLIDEAAVASLPARRIIFASSAQGTPPGHMMLNIEPANDQSRSTGKHCATLTTFTDVEDWFAFHEDATWHEEKDQATLEKIWGHLHAAAPEITNGAEVFETATPQTYYESVRRKMGMIGAPRPSLHDSSKHIEKLLLVGDTVSRGMSLADIADQSRRLAGILHP